MTSMKRDFIKYASLNVLGMLGISCYILADTFFIANGLGTKGLTALNLAIPVYSFINGSGLMFGMGGGTKYAIRRSRGDAENGNKVFTGTVCSAAAISLIFVFLGLFCSGQITGILGADDEVFEMTAIYLKMILLFAPAFIMNNVMICFVRNDGSPRLAMAAMMLGSLSNIILDYIFIFPLGMGIFGAVLATGFSPIIGMAILSLHKIKGRNQFHFVKARIEGRATLNTVSLGLPSLIAELSSGVVIIVFNLLILGIEGNVGVAAYGVVANISLVVIALYTGIAQGIQPLASDAYGQGRKADITLLLKYALGTAVIFSAVIYLCLFVFSGEVTGIFNSEENLHLQEIAERGLKLYFIGAAFAGANIIIATVFASTERPIPAQLISILRGLLIIVPVAFLLSHLLGMDGVWLAFPATEIVVLMFSALCWIRR